MSESSEDYKNANVRSEYATDPEPVSNNVMFQVFT